MLGAFTQAKGAKPPAEHPLGMARASFGDKMDAPEWRSQDGFSAWFLQQTFEDSPTDIYFPAGRADERFYLNYMRAGTEKNPNWHTVLTYETRHNGVIHLIWRLNLAKEAGPFDSEMISHRRLGTLAAMLARFGYVLKDHVTPKVRAQLRRIGGLAGYNFRPDPSGPGIYYWWVRPDGTESARRLDEGVHHTEGLRFPRTQMPYPIPTEEALLLSGGRKEAS